MKYKGLHHSKIYYSQSIQNTQNTQKSDSLNLNTPTPHRNIFSNSYIVGGNAINNNNNPK